MRVLLYEQFYGGHHFQYLHYLLISLIDITDEVILAMTEESQKTPAFSALIAPFLNRIKIIHLPPNLKRGITGWIELYHNLHHTVRQVQPDYLLIPSADCLTSRTCLLRLDSLLKAIPTEVAIHRGLGRYSMGFRQYVTEVWYRQKMLACSPWSTIHVVNAVFYEMLQSQHNTLLPRIKLLPDPVPPNPRHDKSASRIRLGIPENGRYIGFFGIIDRRRIDKLLAAFQASALGTNDRLLLGGSLSKEFQQLIEQNYQNLIKQDRLIILNRYLSEEEFISGFSAVDVICIPTLSFSGLSSILLKGIAAKRPILTNNNLGWSRMIIKRFQVGWLCNMLNPEEFSSSLLTALEECETYQESEAIQRLLEFHSPKNFGAHWCMGLQQAMGKTIEEPVRSWDWVLEALPPERRILY
jgi:glycosyltransferase involved in cell wall biosynthesis